MRAAWKGGRSDTSHSPDATCTSYLLGEGGSEGRRLRGGKAGRGREDLANTGHVRGCKVDQCPMLAMLGGIQSLHSRHKFLCLLCLIVIIQQGTWQEIDPVPHGAEPI